MSGPQRRRGSARIAFTRRKFSTVTRSSTLSRHVATPPFIIRSPKRGHITLPVNPTDADVDVWAERIIARARDIGAVSRYEGNEIGVSDL